MTLLGNDFMRAFAVGVGLMEMREQARQRAQKMMMDFDAARALERFREQQLEISRQELQAAQARSEWERMRTLLQMQAEAEEHPLRLGKFRREEEEAKRLSEYRKAVADKVQELKGMPLNVVNEELYRLAFAYGQHDDARKYMMGAEVPDPGSPVRMWHTIDEQGQNVVRREWLGPPEIGTQYFQAINTVEKLEKEKQRIGNELAAASQSPVTRKTKALMETLPTQLQHINEQLEEARKREFDLIRKGQEWLDSRKGLLGRIPLVTTPLPEPQLQPQPVPLPGLPGTPAQLPGLVVPQVGVQTPVGELERERQRIPPELRDFPQFPLRHPLPSEQIWPIRPPEPVPDTVERKGRPRIRVFRDARGKWVFEPEK